MSMPVLRVSLAVTTLAVAVCAGAGSLEVAAKIPLPGGQGRMDHLACDEDAHRLFVAELGNASVAVVDLEGRRLDRRLRGFHEPQGVVFLPSLARLYVSDGGDGSVVAYDARSLRLLGRRELGGDADNIRIDPEGKRLYVGHDEALAVLDASSLEMVADIALGGHPEGFQLASAGAIYVNVPAGRQVAVVDGRARRVITKWSGISSANYPMALEESGDSVLTVFRTPATIARYSAADGAVMRSARACEDADDLFIDAARDRLYVICGEGVVDVLDRGTLRRIDRIETVKGARTGLFSPRADTLFVAARAAAGRDAAIWVLKPR